MRASMAEAAVANGRSFIALPALALLACCAFATPARAQRCEDNTNPLLRAALVRGDQRAVDSSVVTGLRRATSYLCGYEPWKGTDPDSSDAWCEGARGTGVGEMLAWVDGVGGDGVALPREIWVGYGKSESLFRANGRPRRVRVWAVGVEMLLDVCGDETCGPDSYERARSLGSIDVELRDVNGWQPLPVPQHRVTSDSNHEPNMLVGIEILSVYPGARYTDTCVSGIRRAPNSAPRP